MKMKDIKIGEQYYIADTAFWNGLGLRGNERIIGRVVLTEVESPTSSRRDHVTIVIENDQVKRAHKEKHRTHTVNARYIEDSVANVAAQLERNRIENEEQEFKDRQRLRRIGEMADPEILGHNAMALAYSPSEDAYALIETLDNVIAQATRLKAMVTDAIDNDDEDDRLSRRSLPKKYEDDGFRRFPSLVSDISWFTNGTGRAVEALMRYERSAQMFNVFSAAGVDFKRAVDIRHGRDEGGTR